MGPGLGSKKTVLEFDPEEALSFRKVSRGEGCVGCLEHNSTTLKSQSPLFLGQGWTPATRHPTLTVTPKCCGLPLINEELENRP